MGECGCNLEVARCAVHATDMVIVADRNDLVQTIAAELDKPSLYMGGPSPSSRRRAERVVDQLGRFDAAAKSRVEPPPGESAS